MYVVARTVGESVTLEMPDGTRMRIIVSEIRKRGFCCRLALEIPLSVKALRTDNKRPRPNPRRKKAAK